MEAKPRHQFGRAGWGGQRRLARYLLYARA
jgi:hypothetical protein